MSETDVSSQSGRLSMESPGTSLSEEYIGYDYRRIAGTALDADKIPLHERLGRRPRRPVEDGARRPVRDGHWNGRLDEDNKIRGDTWAPGDREAALEWGRKRDLQRRAADRRDSVSSSNDGESSIEFGSDVSLTDQLTGYLDNAFGLGDTPDRGRVSVGEAREIKADVRSSLVASLDESLPVSSAWSASIADEDRFSNGSQESGWTPNQGIEDAEYAVKKELERQQHLALRSQPPGQTSITGFPVKRKALPQNSSHASAGGAPVTLTSSQGRRLSPVIERSPASSIIAGPALDLHQPDLHASHLEAQQQHRPLRRWESLESYRTGRSGASSPFRSDSAHEQPMTATIDFSDDSIAQYEKLAAVAAADQQDDGALAAERAGGHSVAHSPVPTEHVLSEPGDYDYTAGSEIPLEPLKRHKGAWLPKTSRRLRQRGRRLKNTLFSAAPTSILSRSRSHVSSSVESSVSGSSIISAEGGSSQRLDDGGHRDHTQEHRSAGQSRKLQGKPKKPRRRLPFSGLVRRGRRPRSPQ